MSSSEDTTELSLADVDWSDDEVTVDVMGLTPVAYKLIMDLHVALPPELPFDTYRNVSARIRDIAAQVMEVERGKYL